jgi:hypothetical protein
VACNTTLNNPLLNTSFDQTMDHERNLAEHSASLAQVLKKQDQYDEEDTEDDAPPTKK